MKSKIISLIGWYGVIATVLAYMFVSFGLMSPVGMLYQVLNLTGAIGITIETWVKRDYQPFWLNLIWAIIALVAIINIFKIF